MATAKQRAWRKKFAAMYGKGKKRARSSRKVKTMARRRRSGRRSGSGGLLRKVIYGGIAGYLADRYLPQIIPQVPKLVQNAAIGYVVSGKSLEGGLAGAGAPMVLGGAANTLQTSAGWD